MSKFREKGPLTLYSMATPGAASSQLTSVGSWLTLIRGSRHTRTTRKAFILLGRRRERGVRMGGRVHFPDMPGLNFVVTDERFTQLGMSISRGR